MQKPVIATSIVAMLLVATAQPISFRKIQQAQIA